jgi:hypothetical protein
VSLLQSKTYFRERLTGLAYKEWTDGFNIENIPSTLFNKAFHVEHTGTNGSPHDNMCVMVEPSYLVRVFLKGFKDPRAKIDQAMDFAEDIIKDCISSPQRLNPPQVWNVKFNQLDIRPLETNDNAIIIEIGFTCSVMIETN